MFKKKFDDKEVECPNCHQKIKPFIKLNRVKSEFIGARYTGKDKAYWLICPKCNMVIGKK
jgi:hypothetical protein